MSRHLQSLQPIMTAKAADGKGTSLNVGDFRHLTVQLATASSAAGTIKFVGSISDACPDFGSAASATNMWDYVCVIDCDSGQPIPGSTGITLSGTDDVRNFEINQNNFKWLSAVLSSRTAGTFTVNLLPATNE